MELLCNHPLKGEEFLFVRVTPLLSLIHYVASISNRMILQGATARNSVEWFVFAVFCFVTTFAIVPEVSITLVMQ